MPMYEYRCPNCGATYEKLRRAAEADRDVECPECGAREVERMVSTFATSGTSCGAPAGSGFR